VNALSTDQNVPQQLITTSLQLKWQELTNRAMTNKHTHCDKTIFDDFNVKQLTECTD